MEQKFQKHLNLRIQPVFQMEHLVLLLEQLAVHVLMMDVLQVKVFVHVQVVEK